LPEPFGVLPAWQRIRDGVIDFSVGQPSRDMLPLAELAEASRHCFSSASGDERRYLQYGPSQGDTGSLERLATFLESEYGHPVDHGTLFVTNGVSQGLELVCAMFTRPGQKILVEEPTYFLAAQIFRDHGLEIVTAPIDDQGLIIDGLEELFEKHRPSLLYCVTTHGNPSGATLPVDRRARLVELAERYDFHIAADEVYQLLSFPDVPPPPAEMYSFDRGRGRVLGLQTFSKILAPGLRLGWIQATPEIVGRFQERGYITSGGGLNPVGAALVESCLTLDLVKPFVEGLRRAYGRRARALVEAIRKELPQAEIAVEPGGGYFLWLRFPEGTPVASLGPERANDAGVALMPGSRFRFGAESERFEHHARLCFAYYDSAALVEGVRRLGAALA
jgi:DNA-binding transcriptional MocR family regulator